MMAVTHRWIEPACHEALAQHKVLVLLGARQTGKSTLAKRLVAGWPPELRLYLNLDDPFLRDQLLQARALENAIEQQARRPLASLDRFVLVLDEAQKAPELFERIKALHDAYRERLTFILTGSSALAIHDPAAESLAGRARFLHVLPFTLAEAYAHAQGRQPEPALAERMSRLLRGAFTPDDFDALVEETRYDAEDRRAWVERHLLFPLFPEPSAQAEPEAWLRDYLVTYLEKDVQSLAAVGNVALYRQALRQLAARVGAPIKWETAAHEIGTSNVTLRKYAGLLEQTFNLIRLEPFLLNPVQRIVKAPKLYWIDNGLTWALRQFEDRRLLEASGQLGNYAEQLAIAEIAKWCAVENTAPDLRFWSKSDLAEVDLVVSNRGYQLAFEVKLGRQLERKWRHGLDAFAQAHSTYELAMPYRFLLHFGEPKRIDDKTYALPLWMLT